MSNIIEKLGIKPIDTMYLALSSRHELQDKILELEQQNRDMIEALIVEWFFIEEFMACQASLIDMCWYQSFVERQQIIQKQCEKIIGLKWQKIKELS